MPTATQFNALGKGNGFPFCLRNRTEAQIAAREVSGSLQRRLRYNGSLAQVMKIFWNLYSLRFEIDVSIPTPESTSVDETSKFHDAGDFEVLYENEYGQSPVGIVDVVNSPSDRCVINDSVIDGYEFFSTSDLPEVTPIFSAPEWYYNTTNNNYAIIFHLDIELNVDFPIEGEIVDIYTSNEANWGGGIDPRTVSIFGNDYTLYSEGGQITIDDITITEDYFTYT